MAAFLPRPVEFGFVLVVQGDFQGGNPISESVKNTTYATNDSPLDQIKVSPHNPQRESGDTDMPRLVEFGVGAMMISEIAGDLEAIAIRQVGMKPPSKKPAAPGTTIARGRPSAEMYGERVSLGQSDSAF